MRESDVLEAIAVTAECMGSEMSPGAAKMMLSDLSRFPPKQIIGALKNVRRNVKGKLTVADIIRNIDDGRPGPEEAWAMIPKDESGSVVWTQEMASAFGVACSLIYAGDLIAARMAFLEHYKAEVAYRRDNGEEVLWTTSLGHDPSQREGALNEAVRKGRITFDHASSLCPALPEPSADVLRLLRLKGVTG